MGKVLHASYSGYFPFCINKGKPPLGTGLGTAHPVGIPLKKYMSWWWKIKKWKLTGQSTAQERAGGGDLYNNWTTVSLNQDTVWLLGVAKEEDLVCLRTGVRTIRVGFNGFASTDAGDFGFTNTWDIFFDTTRYYLDGNTIYPHIYVAGWFSSLIPGDPKVITQVDPYTNFYIDGVRIPVYTSWFPFYTLYSDWSWSGSQEFNLDPEEYWSYGKTWNTATGNPL